ncbi:MAG: hypothetical protein RR476_04960, partial [Cetobacterium sp.]
MNNILLYIIIIAVGFFLSKKKVIPNFLKKKLALLQSLSLFFLLGIMGYNIGSNDQIIKDFHLIGSQAFIIGSLSVIFSILITFIVFKK